MDQKNIMKVIIAMMFFMVGCVPKSANDLCPDVQGTYIIDGSHEFFIKKNATGQYKAIVTIDDSYRLLSVDIPTKEELKQDNLPRREFPQSPADFSGYVSVPHWPPD